MRYKLTSRLQRDLHKRDKGIRDAAFDAIENALKNYGKPHTHAGASIRDYKPPFKEVRIGLHLRLLFYRDGDFLVFCCLGTHREVATWCDNNS